MNLAFRNSGASRNRPYGKVVGQECVHSLLFDLIEHLIGDRRGTTCRCYCIAGGLPMADTECRLKWAACLSLSLRQ